MDLTTLGSTVFIRTAARTLELRWYSPVLLGAVNEILARVVRHIRASCGGEGDGGAFERLNGALDSGFGSRYQFAACCEGDIEISLELVGRAELTVAEHCAQSLAAASGAAVAAATVATEPWHDTLPEMLAAQIPERLSLELTPDGVFLIFERTRGFDSAVSALAALLTSLFGYGWRDAVGRNGTAVRTEGLETLLRPALSHGRWEEEFFVGSEWLFGLVSFAEGANGCIGIRVAEERLADIEKWITSRGAAWGLDMSAWIDFES